MIRVEGDDAIGWTWRMIDAASAVLVWQGPYPTQLEAAAAARDYRAAFFRVAARIDHRQGACI